MIAKPRGGSSSIGVIRARKVSALPIDELGDEYIVQQAVTGYEVTVDFAVDHDGRLLGLSARRSIEMRGGEDSKAVTIEHPHLRAEVERLIAALPGAFGVLNLAVFVDDEAGRMHFTELNPRFGGGYPLSWHAGARFPLSLVNGEDEVCRMDARPCVVMLRYDQAVFEDAPTSVTRCRDGDVDHADPKNELAPSSSGPQRFGSGTRSTNAVHGLRCVDHLRPGLQDVLRKLNDVPC